MSCFAVVEHLEGYKVNELGMSSGCGISMVWNMRHSVN